MTPADRKAAQQRAAQEQWVKQHADGTSTHYERHDLRLTIGDVLVTKEIVTSIHRIGPGPDRPDEHCN